MKIRFAVILTGLVVSFTAPTLAQNGDTIDPQIVQQIHVLAMKYDQAFNKNDAVAVAALYTEDAVYVAQRGTFRGRPAIEKAYATYFQRWHSVNHVSTIDRVIAAGDDVRVFGAWSSNFRDTNGASGKDWGHYRWLLVRQGDDWKIRTNTNRSSKGGRIQN